MLGGGRKPLIQSFGTEPQAVVEHCLAANRIRKERDTRLTAVMVLFGLLFLPGLLLWLRRLPAPRGRSPKREDKRAGALGTALLVAVGVLAVLFLIKLPFSGFWALYAARHDRRPGRRLVAGQADLRAHREGPARPLGRPAGRRRRRRQGPRGGARQPRTRPRAEQLRQDLAKLTAEQQSNSSSTPAPRAYSAWAPAGAAGSSPRSWSPTRARQGDPPVPQLGRHTGDPRPAAACWSAARCNTGGFPTPSVTALDRHAGRRERRRGRPARGHRRGGLPGQGPRDTADLQQAAVRRRQPALPGRPVRRSGTASW